MIKLLSIVINVSIIFLPILIYLLNISYNNNYKNKYDKYFLSLLLIFQVLLFFLLKDYTKSLILINIPLLIAYLKRLELTSIIISIIIGISMLAIAAKCIFNYSKNN